MGKTYKENYDFYGDLRKPIPPPSYAHISKKSYDRSKAKEETEEIIKEEIENEMERAS